MSPAWKPRLKLTTAVSSSITTTGERAQVHQPAGAGGKHGSAEQGQQCVEDCSGEVVRMPHDRLDQHDGGDHGERRSLQHDDGNGDPKGRRYGGNRLRIALVGVLGNHDSDDTRG
jgi:hypothetical protein